MGTIIEKIKRRLKIERVEHAAVVLVAALLCLILIACISIHIHSNMQEKYASAMKEAQVEIYQSLQEMTQLFARVEDPNVDVQNKLIPRLQAEYRAVIALNDTLIKGFGNKYAVLDSELISAFDTAFDEYAAAYSAGTATGLAQDDMAVCIAEIQAMIDEYNKPSEDEIIGSLIVANTPAPKK